MFSFFRKKSGPESAPAQPAPAAEPSAQPLAEPRQGWVERLRGGLRRTGSSITQVFTGARIDEALYDELEAALLMADAGPTATRHLLDDLKRRVRDAGATEPTAVRSLLQTRSPTCWRRWSGRSRSGAPDAL